MEEHMTFGTIVMANCSLCEMRSQKSLYLVLLQLRLVMKAMQLHFFHCLSLRHLLLPSLFVLHRGSSPLPFLRKVEQ